MNKKYYWGIVVVLAITAFVTYTEFKRTPFDEITKAAQNLNWVAFAFVFIVMILAFIFEASVVETLAKRRNEPKRSKWSFMRIPLIEALFNAITPMSTGGQPSMLAAMVQMGIEGGRATSILLMKFILYQVVVFFAYITTIIFGFHMVATRFSGLAIFIVIGLIIHVSTTLFLFSIMFAYKWTQNATYWIMNILEKFFSPVRVDRWRKATISKIETFYLESQKLKKEKKKLIVALMFTILQLLCFYSVPYVVVLALNVHASWVEVTQMNIMLIMFMSIIPIPGATGGAEYSFQTLFSAFVSSHGALVLGMFLWRFATYFFGMILGVLGFLFKPKKIKSSEDA